MDDIHFMKQAIEEAKKAIEFNEIPVGAVIVKGGEIIARAFNRRDIDNSPFAHAEMLAIASASEKLVNWRLDGCTIYITLEPCPMCAGAISQCRIERLVYGAKDPKAGAAGTLFNIPNDTRFAHKCRVTAGILEKECKELLANFFLQKRQSRYIAVKNPFTRNGFNIHGGESGI